MYVAIFHYRFDHSGVTRVVLNHLMALNGALRDQGRYASVILLSAGHQEGLRQATLDSLDRLDVSARSLPDLDFTSGKERAPGPEQLADRIREALQDFGFQPDAGVLHIHNHSLGRNPALPIAIRLLAQDGYRFLLQIHDFAEDMRPANYRMLLEALAAWGETVECLYPQAPHIHYATLNGRDYGVLQVAGTNLSRLHLLPNPVAGFDQMPDHVTARGTVNSRFGVRPESRYVVYPVRAVRRKNIGELLLWASLGRDSTVFSVTLPPGDPAEYVSYQHWKDVACENRIPCVFETGGPQGVNIQTNLSAADAVITTSIAEGFGMVFLESWLAGRNLIGRDLPEITADYRTSGINLNHLYEDLLVPVEWIGRERLENWLVGSYNRLLSAYGLDSLSPRNMDRQTDAMLDDETIDFSSLNEPLQTEILLKVHNDAATRERVMELNPRLRYAGDPMPSGFSDTIASNAASVLEQYSLSSCGRRLLDLYQDIFHSSISTDVEWLPDTESILSGFLGMSRTQPLRYE